MKLIPCLAVAAACLMAAACADPGYVEAERRQREYERDYDECVRYGAVPNTPAFSECMSERASYNDAYYSDNRYDDRYYDDSYYSYYDPYPSRDYYYAPAAGPQHPRHKPYGYKDH